MMPLVLSIYCLAVIVAAAAAHLALGATVIIAAVLVAVACAVRYELRVIHRHARQR